MSEMALSVKGITKQIRSRKIVDQVSFEVKKARFSAFSVRTAPVKQRLSG